MSDLQTQKYIKFCRISNQVEQIVVFDGAITHWDMAKCISDSRPVSAGFVRLEIKDNKPVYICFGKSISLGLDSDFDDSEILNHQLRRWTI